MPIGSSSNLPPTSSGNFQTVPSFANLPDPVLSGVGGAYVTADTGTLYISSGVAWFATTGGGPVNGGTGVGGGSSVFKDLLAGVLRFKSLTSTDSSVTISTLANTLDLSVGVVSIAHGGSGSSNQQAAINALCNIGAGAPGDVWTLSGGNAQWLAPAPSGLTGGLNVGTGTADIFKDVVGADFRLRTIGSSDGSMTIGNGADTIDAIVTTPLTYANINSAIGAPTNAFIFSNASSDIVGYGDWSLDATTHMSNVQLFYQPNNLSQGPQAFNWNVNIDPLQDSPNDSITIFNMGANLDSSATGFDMGTAGNSVTLLNGGINYGGNGSIYGRTIHQNWNSGFGNGTDPVQVNGWSGMFQGFNAAANVTIDGNCSAYSANVSLDAAAITTANFSVSGFSETSQLPVDVYGYTGLTIQPSIATLKNTHNFNGSIINPNITTMEGNAGFFGSIIGGNITTQSASNGYIGQQINPNIVHLTQNSYGNQIIGQTTDGTADWDGQFISTTAINTTGTVRGLLISTNAGQFGIDATGHCNMQVGLSVANGLGQAYGHVIGGEIDIPNATAITSTDVIFNNFSATINTGDATSSFVAASPVGISPVGFVGQIIGDGDMSLINFLLNGYAPNFNGNIGRINNVLAACFPNSGTGTLAESVLFNGSQPAGPVGVDNWAFRADDAHLESYMAKLIVGPGSASKKVANASTALEVTGGAFLTSRFDNAGEAGLTALNGMVIYNTDLDKFRGYEAGAWVNLV